MGYLHELTSLLPVLFSLIVIEGLLSVDNALAIAALASHLPEHQQTYALRIGILGAYVFRGLAMFLVAFIIANSWLKILGAAYLIYLMASNLAGSSTGEPGVKRNGTSGRRSLFMTVLQIEVMDLTLSLDNIVAAVAFDQRVWVVCTGIFIGILVLRYLAGWCIRLSRNFPVLEVTAFLLIGFVGVILSVEVGTEITRGGKHGVHVTASEKFAGIVTILALSLLYERTAIGRTVLRPIVVAGALAMLVLDKIFGAIFWPAAKCIHQGKVVFGRKPAIVQGPAQDDTPSSPAER